ncbi:MAG: peptidylprolyl isomerase [Pseudomonadota bacterium]
MRTFMIASALSGLIATLPVHAQEAPETAPEGEVSYDATTVLATVNGTEITLGNLIVLRSRLPQQYQQVPDATLFPGLVDQLIDQTLLAQSKSSNPADDPVDVQILLQNERRGALAASAITDMIADPLPEAEIEEVYGRILEDFVPEPEFNASHILVDSEETAASLKSEIEGGADFAEVAQANSLDGSAQTGGELGWFGLGRMVAPFEAAIVEMEVGDVVGPVQTDFGWHLIKLNDARETAPPALEELRLEIEDQLRQTQVQDAVVALREEAQIERPDVSIPPAAIRDMGLIEQLR